MLRSTLFHLNYNLDRFLIVLGWAASLHACTPSNDQPVFADTAKKYCSTCHRFPEPELLDKRTWEDGVLPAMAEKLGIEVLQGNVYLHHKTSAMGAKEWNEIVQYYKTLAPDSLPLPQQAQLREIDTLFSIRKPFSEQKTVSNTTLVAFDTLRHQVLSGTGFEPALSFWDKNLQAASKVSVPSPPVAYVQSKALLTCMGGMHASDKTMGQILKITHQQTAPVLTDSLIRPVYAEMADFDRDGTDDYLISAFGHNRGRLYVYKQSSGKFWQQIVREVPGATHTVVRDFNHDGWPDIIALFAHGDEGIWLFLNDRKGSFTSRCLLRFPPVYGSSSFQLADLNGDGLEDILYTAGDNSDYSRILKPYHGIYIFTNTGKLAFRQTHFFPMHGCTKAVAADFDLDGDADIAAIAFFADFSRGKQQGFLYLEQQKNPESRKTIFRSATLPIKHEGRWICMDVGDWDGDGDQDLVLGSFSRGFLNQERIQPDWDVYNPFILLENNAAAKRINHPASNLPAAR